jgi:integrase
MTVLVDGGLRKGETRNLCAGRCLLEARQLVVVGGNGGKDRVIPMGERLASVLADLFLTDGVEPDQFVWYGRGGNQHGHTSISRSRAIGEGTFHRWWERSLEGPGVRYRNPHTAPSHVRHAVAAARRAHGHALESDGPRLDRHDRRPLRTP